MALISTTIFVFSCALLLVSADYPYNNRPRANHDEGRLHKYILSDYNTDFRPVADHKSTVTVKIRLALKYISFDALEETFTLHSWVAMAWKDEYLTWTPADYGNINETQVESHEIWTPRMALYNADVTLYQPDTFYSTCMVTYEGVVTCVPHLAHSGICKTELRRWPYDSQNCTLYFGSWMHTGEQINFTFYKSKPILTDDYQDGPGWKLLKATHERLPGSYGKSNTSYPMLKYVFMLKREAAGPAAIVVVPSVVIVMLTLTSLLLDIKDNTRLFMACFSLFGHFIFITEIGYNIPKHSSDTPILLLFVRDSMIVTLTAILVTLVLMALRRRTVAAPAWMVAVNRLVSSGPGKYVVFTEFDPNDVTDGKVLTADSSSAFDGQKSCEIHDWLDFANLLNSCMFIVTCVVYIVLISSYIPSDD